MEFSGLYSSRKVGQTIKKGLNTINDVIASNNPFLKNKPALVPVRIQGLSIPGKDYGYLMASRANLFSCSPSPLEAARYYDNSKLTIYQNKASVEIVDDPFLKNMQSLGLTKSDEYFKNPDRPLERKIAEDLAKLETEVLGFKNLADCEKASLIMQAISSLNDYSQFAAIKILKFGKPKLVGYISMTLKSFPNRPGLIADLSPALYLPKLAIDLSKIDLPLPYLVKLLALQAKAAYDKGAREIVAVGRDMRLVHALTCISDTYDPDLGGAMSFPGYEFEKQHISDYMTGVRFESGSWIAKNFYHSNNHPLSGILAKGANFGSDLKYGNKFPSISESLLLTDDECDRLRFISNQLSNKNWHHDALVFFGEINYDRISNLLK